MMLPKRDLIHFCKCWTQFGILVVRFLEKAENSFIFLTTSQMKNHGFRGSRTSSFQLFCNLFRIPSRSSLLFFCRFVGAVRLIFGSHFTSLVWALGFWKNQWTEKTVVADKWGNTKINQKWIQKSSKIMKNRVWDHPGGSRGRLGDHFGPRTAQGSKRGPRSREILVCFWHQNGDLVQLFVGCFLVFFEVLVFQIFYDFGCPKTLFLLPFWL